MGIILGFTPSHALWSYYTASKSISELCRVAFNWEIDYDNTWCVFNETFSDEELLWDISFNIKWKEYSSAQIMILLDTAITKKYKKLWYEDGTPWMVKAKSRLYDSLLTKIWNDFPSSSIQNNTQKRKLYAWLYLVLSVSKFRNGNEYVEAVTNIYGNDNLKKYGTTKKPETQWIRLKSGEVVEVELSIWEWEEARKIMWAADYREPTQDEIMSPNIRYIDSIAWLTSTDIRSNEEKYPRYKENYRAKISQAWYLSTWVSESDVQEIEASKARIEAETNFMLLSDFDKQMKSYNVSYDGLSPSYDVYETGLAWMQERITTMSQWPRTTWYIWRQNGLIYKHIVDDMNIYIWLLIDWGLVNYHPELVRETGFFRTYVWPFYGDSNNWWKNSTIYGKNAEKVLAYFGYSIDLDPLSSSYLELDYDASKNEAIWQIDYIENTWK